MASIRPRPSADEFEHTTEQADSFSARAITLRSAIKFAYGITFDRELTGGPNWAETDKFDIDARTEDPVALQKLPHDDLDQQMRLMMQSLLADRFGLRVSFVKKTLPVYTLEIAKGGLRCQQVTPPPESQLTKLVQPRFAWSSLPPPPPPPPGWTPPPPDEAHVLSQTLRLGASGWPFWLMVTVLSHQPELGGRTVIDKTGLKGNYDCRASWSQTGSDGQGPSFFTALQEQMGLKLEPGKGEVETVVIESVDRPSEN